MLDNTTGCTGELQKSEKNTKWYGIAGARTFTVALSVALFLLSVSYLPFGAYVAISIFLSMFTVSLVYKNFGMLGYALEITLSVVILVMSCVMPPGYLVHTKEGIALTKKTTFMSPFDHVRPRTLMPERTGQLEVKNGLPQNWSVSVWYWVPPNAELASKDWVMFQKILSEGVEVPHHLLTFESLKNHSIEAYLEKEYPFMRAESTVEYDDSKVWK